MSDDNRIDDPHKELKLMIFLPCLKPLGMRSIYDEARLRLLCRRIWAETEDVHPNYLNQTGIFQVLTSTDTESEETKDILLDSAPALERLEGKQWKHLLSKSPVLDISTEESFKKEEFLTLIKPDVRILFVIRPSGDLFFFKRITGIFDPASTGNAYVYHVEAHLVSEITPVRKVL